MTAQNCYACLLLVALSAAMAATPAMALDELKLDGVLFLDKEACAKATAGEGCTPSIQLSGAPAKAIYDAMMDEGVKEECTGGIEKSDGQGLHCITYDDGTAACDFGYDFAKKEFGGSGVSC